MPRHATAPGQRRRRLGGDRTAVGDTTSGSDQSRNAASGAGAAGGGGNGNGNAATAVASGRGRADAEMSEADAGRRRAPSPDRGHGGSPTPTAVPSLDLTRAAPGPRAQRPPDRPLLHVRPGSSRACRRWPCSRDASSSSTTSADPPTTSARSTATSTSAASRTSSPAWKPRSSTSPRRRTPVLYRGDVQYDQEDIVEHGGRAGGPKHRGHPAGPADDHVPGHQEPDRGQGGTPHPGGVVCPAASW